MDSQKNLIENSSDLFKIINDQLPMGILIIQDENIKYINRICAEIFGYLQNEMNNWNITELSSLLSPKDHEKFINQLVSYHEGENVTEASIEYQIIRKDEKLIWIHQSSRIIHFKGKLAKLITLNDITKTKLREKSLNDINAELTSIINSSSDFIIILDNDLKIQFMNRFELGFTKEQLMGNPLYEIVPKEERERIKKNYEEVIKTRVPLTHETHFITPQNRVISFESTIAPLIHDDNITGLVINTRDISKRKARTNALREKEELFRLISLVVSDLVYEWDVKTDRLNWFGDIEGALGYENGKIDHTIEAWFNHIHPDDQKRLTEAVEFHRITGEPIDIEYKICKKNGEIRIWSDRGIAILGDDGKPTKLIGACTDITEKIHVNNQLKLSDELLKQMPDAILVVDTDGKIKRWMGNSESIFGFSKDEAVNQPISIIQKYPENQKEIMKALNETGAYYGEIECLRKDGSSIPIEFTAKNVNNKEGNVIASVGINRDISLRKKTEKLLQDYINSQANFISMTSHELRTPLTVIKGYAEFLEKKIFSLDPINVKKSIQKIIKGVERLELLISDVKDVSLFEKNLLSLNLEIFDFTKFIDEIIANYKIILQNKLQFIPIESSSPIKVKGDILRLQQVFDNIISNAIKFTSENERIIDVTLNTINNHIKVKITDNGAGIESCHLEDIFNLFTSFDTDYSIKGTGIGLFIAKEIIQDHGGRLYAESEGKGRGSSFTVEIPLFVNDGDY